MQVMNPYHQERPLCGASIGAFRGEHLPPVSYGGVILVDDEPLGMSVHHLLDAPSDDEDDIGEEPDSPLPSDVMLSSAANNPWLMGMGEQPDLYLESDEPAAMWDLELSDDDDLKSEDEDADIDSFEFSDSELESDDDSAEGMSTRYSMKGSNANLVSDMADSIVSRATMGDIDGIVPGEGEEIKITQPATMIESCALQPSMTSTQTFSLTKKIATTTIFPRTS